MFRILCKSKIMNAIITSKDLQYSGSIGIDKTIIEASDIMIGEQVHVLNVNNGERFTTYVIEEKADSGKIVLYGPAARKGDIGDGLVILTYCMLESKECHNFSIKKIFLAKNNQYKNK
ncbi:MAG: aspartate 1-decarboxylase [Candidatus Omnitrophota bacterium]